MFNANNVEQSIQFVTYTSSCMAGANGVSITKDKYNNCISGFCARSLMASESNWIIGHDEFMIPDITHTKYKQWENDCVVLSLFHSKSNPSSLRNVDYAGKFWNIQNEFFWLSVKERSVKEMENLAGGKYSTDDINTAIEDDIEAFGKERFVYKKLQTITLSPDAQAVLDKVTELVKSSFKHRKEFNQKHPEYHINTWDAGWYQIKRLLKEHDPNGLKQFNELYKALEDRMRPLVYELGFLYK